MIPITRAYLPDRKKVDEYLDSIYERAWLTNNGPLVQKLTERLSKYLNIEAERVVLVANGSLALHLAYKLLDLKGDVITTPFSFVATSSTLAWEGLTPVFCDVDLETFNLSPELIDQRVTKNTSAIVPVHVFGNPCDIEEIEAVAKARSLAVIYDASHCFGTELNGKSVLEAGDISTISFHATKLFHSVEGGAMVFRDKGCADKARKMINFGISGPDQISCLGTNAKMSEFHAAVGLAVLDEIDHIRACRESIWNAYSEGLTGFVTMQKRLERSSNNHAYFPVLLEDENQLLRVKSHLESASIFPRRYFFPSLDSLPFVESERPCLHSNDIASRILCLPIYPGLSIDMVKLIVEYVKMAIQKK